MTALAKIIYDDPYGPEIEKTPIDRTGRGHMGLYRRPTGTDINELDKSKKPPEQFLNADQEENSFQIYKNNMTGENNYNESIDLSRPAKQIISAKPDTHAQRVLRTHFVKVILADLEKIKNCSGESRAAVYAASLMKTMRTMRDILTWDPYLEVVMALYDALAFQNNWLNYNSEQYSKAHDILKNLANQSKIDGEKVEKAIIALEEAGFDTTPFETELG